MNRVLEVDDLAVFRAQTSAQTAVEHISLRSVRLTCMPTPARTDEVTHLASHASSAHPVPVWRARANTKTRRLRARLRISYPIYTSALTHPAMKSGRRNQAPSARARSPAPPLLRPLPTATRVLFCEARRVQNDFLGRHHLNCGVSHYDTDHGASEPATGALMLCRHSDISSILSSFYLFSPVLGCYENLNKCAHFIPPRTPRPPRTVLPRFRLGA